MEYSLDDIELEYDDFVLKFFSSPPKECSMVSISLDCETIQDLFEKLVLLFKDGLVYFYGDNNKKINLESLSSDQIGHINKYFNSFRVNVNFKVISIKDLENYENEIISVNSKVISYMKSDKALDSTEYKLDLIDILDYKHIMSNSLEDRRFRLRKENYIYIIWFNLLQ
jgi:hypothetical protein